jgi:hypothetical protein
VAEDDAMADDAAALAAELSAATADDSAAAAEDSAGGAAFLQAARPRAAMAASDRARVTDFFMEFSLRDPADRPAELRTNGNA